ncbi:MAG: transposase, partial [Ethanoligenens sp.]
MTNEEWERIVPLLPPEKTGQKGRPRKSNRTMLNGMLWMARSGCQWREGGADIFLDFFMLLNRCFS